MDDEKSIKLSNIILANQISENVISLRRFADLGLSIYLDNEKLSIHDNISGIE